MASKRLVIIGGDAAGMSAAAQAQRTAGAGALDIVVFERTGQTSYAACGLPYLVGGFVAAAERLVART
ncbi:MAG TPA: flavoprotein oxidoreductase, partial [Quisquiliibacterium sp.]|nr:flavoprotein oxidoreductase [Quisquiliibacterium sp.]